MAEIRLAIIGYREFADYEYAKKCIKSWQRENGKIDLIVSGGARGADSLAERYAREHNIPTKILKPDWAGLGRSAGILRNTDIINESTHVLAFVSESSVGTWDSIRKAKSKGLPVTQIDIDSRDD